MKYVSVTLAMGVFAFLTYNVGYEKGRSNYIADRPDFTAGFAAGTTCGRLPLEIELQRGAVIENVTFHGAVRFSNAGRFALVRGIKVYFSARQPAIDVDVDHGRTEMMLADSEFESVSPPENVPRSNYVENH